VTIDRLRVAVALHQALEPHQVIAAVLKITGSVLFAPFP